MHKSRYSAGAAIGSGRFLPPDQVQGRLWRVELLNRVMKKDWNSHIGAKDSIDVTPAFEAVSQTQYFSYFPPFSKGGQGEF
ncbi:MAG: hypothetical protein ABSF52_01735 [Syntrophobacteraceae bacterium]|jgi:hypothetical protein